MTDNKTDPDTVSTRQTLLGFDYGVKRIGVAVGQTATHQASALQTLTSRHNKPDWDAISGLIDEWRPDALIVGHPVHMDGSAQPMTRAAEKFARQLTGRYHLPVHLVEERLTSDAAESDLRQQKPGYSAGDIDMQAACIILQDWLAQQDKPQSREPHS